MVGTIDTVVVPTVRQVVPSVEIEPVIVDPLRTRRSHTGTGCVAPDRYVVHAPVEAGS